MRAGTAGKGCGKTYILLVLFILCWSEDKYCLYLTPSSFKKYRVCKEYIRDFVDKNNYIDDANKKSILNESLSITDMIQQFLKYCTACYYLWICPILSLSQKAVTTLKQFDGAGAKVFVSFSSGAISVKNYTKFHMLLV